eukprot:gene54134-72351_t
MLAFDYETVNYKEAQSPTSELIFVNNLVNSNFQSASNIRVGGEYNYLDYRFRAGYALYASPFNDAILSAVNNDNLALQVYSVGFGYQEPDGKLFFDAAVTYERFDDYYTPYLLETTNRPYFTSANKIGITRLLFTGWSCIFVKNALKPMTEWWTALDGFDKMLWAITLVATLIFIFQTIATFTGMDSDGGVDADFSGDMETHHGGDTPFQLFTFRNFVNFFLGFGWTVLSLEDTIGNR